MRRDDIRSLHREVGTRGFVRVLAEALEGRYADGTEMPKGVRLRPEEVSLRALWEGLVGPCEETLPSLRSGGFGALSYVEMQEAIDSTAFASATGLLVAAKVIEGYNQPGMIGDQLVTTMQSKLKSERIVGFTATEGPKEVPEGMPYEESTFEEKYVTTQTAKKGRIIELTEEAVYFDQTGQVLMRAAQFGKMTAQERELIILAGVVDVGGAAGVGQYKPVYRPSGTAVALYGHATYQNHLATATPLADWTDIDEALQYHADNQRDDRAHASDQLPLAFMPKTLLVARKKAATAARILTATEHRTSDGSNETLISGNPVINIAPGLKALSSSLLDFLATVSGSQYDDADDWFFGDFQAQFIWQEIWPLQTLRAAVNDEAQFRRDVLARHKVRYYGGINAIDHRHVIKVNAV